MLLLPRSKFEIKRSLACRSNKTFLSSKELKFHSLDNFCNQGANQDHDVMHLYHINDKNVLLELKIGTIVAKQVIPFL